ncbi:MAG: alpha/beta hydrolase family protein [Gemmatimonadales bacterium]
MATPTRTSHTLAGVLGDLAVDVRTAERRHAAPAVLVVHGFKGFKDWGMFPPFAERLARAGFTAVAVTLSGAGVDAAGAFSFPERFGHNTFSAEQRDLDVLLAALDGGELGVPRPSSVGIVGHSRGGGAAVLLAGRQRRIGALVTWAAIATVDRWPPAVLEQWRAAGRVDVVNSRTGEVLPLYRDTLDDIEANRTGSLDIVAAAGRVAVPWLLIHGDADETVPVREAERLAVAATIPQFERLTVPGAGHTFGAVHPFAGAPASLETVFDASVRFLGRWLR